MKKNNYTAKDIKTLDGIESVRTRPGMYIGSIDSDGLHHLLLEIVSNSIDEYLNGYGTNVRINISKDEKSVQIKDNGRGIPFGKTKTNTEAIIDLCTNLHSGGKFGQGGYSVSGGLHGIGLTAVNALSSQFSIISIRDNKKAILTASKGQISNFKVEKNIAKEQNGTTINFTPDTAIFEGSCFEIKKIEKIIKELSFLTSGMEFYVNDKLFISKNGLKDMIQDKVEDPITEPIYIKGSSEGFLVEVAFQFENRRTEKIYAFTNNIPNREGGTHITGFKSAFTSSINKLARKYGLLNDKDKNLNGDTIRNGILAAVSVKMNKAPVFQGQTKEKLMTAEARGIVSKITNENFENAISKKDIKTIVDRALVEQKAEAAAKRSREAAKKMATGGRNMKNIKDLPSKLTDSIGRENAELWILEGK